MIVFRGAHLNGFKTAPPKSMPCMSSRQVERTFPGCSTTPGTLYSWLWALVRGSRATGGVSPLWRAAAACERLRRTCPGELVGLSCADSGAG